MPMYIWETPELPGENIKVIRKVADIEMRPTNEEVREAGVEIGHTVDVSEWEWARVMCAPVMKRGWKWGAGKGNW